MRLMAREAYRRPVLWWAGTRLILLLWAIGAVPCISHGAVAGDVALYSRWAQYMQGQGNFPSYDPQWQYPPGAALIMLLPQLFVNLGMSYIVVFYFFALAADFAVFRLLLGQADRIAAETGAPAHLSGLWAWVGGGFAIGPLILMRYDVIVTAVSVGGLLGLVGTTAKRSAETANKRTWALRGALIGLGAIIKVWPAVLLAGLPSGRDGRRALSWAIGAGVVVSAILCVLMGGGLSFITGQYGRGIEVESVLASPFMVAAWFGYNAQTVHEFGAFQIAGTGVDVVGSCSLLLTVIGLGFVVWWRLRRFNHASWSPALMYDVALTVVLIMVVTDRVLSPQYLIWLMGLASLCLAENGPTRRASVMATPAKLVMACVLITQIEFPILFGEVMYHQFFGTILVAARNTTLVVATVLAIKHLWRASTKPPADAADPDGAAAPDPADQPAENADEVPAAAVHTAGTSLDEAGPIAVDGISVAAGAPAEPTR